MATRQGQWAYTLPFALNTDWVGTYSTSMTFYTPTITLTPVLAEFVPSGNDPSGSRHLTTHESFSEVLASGAGVASASYGYVDFSVADISTGSGVSKTKAFLFRMAEIGTTKTRIHNMKVWASNTDDFLTPQNAKVIFETHRSWKGDYSLPVSYLTNTTKWLPTSLPDAQNLYRQDGGLTIHASGDEDVSEWIYTAVAASGTLPLGQYGLTSSSGFLLRITYDADNLYPLFD